MRLDEIIDELRGSFAQKTFSRWPGSRHEWIWQLSSTQKGSIGETIVKEYLARCGMNVGPRTSKENDFTIVKNRQYKFENKLSCLNEDGRFKWLSIRMKEDYDQLALVGINPDSSRVFVLPKKVLIEQYERKMNGDYVPEIGFSNGGKNHLSHLYISVDPDNLPLWLSRWEITDRLKPVTTEVVSVN